MHQFSKYIKKPYAEMEVDVLEFWKQNQVFQQSVDQRSDSKTYVFYDGPPFITGLPHHGTLLSSIIKDVIPRYKTMRGYQVKRLWGWDCHGLPAENFVEKKLNLPDKQAVLDYGLEKYIKVCRENMIQTGSLWEESIERIGRWVEFKNAYKTMDNSYMESVWWAFKQLYEAGKIYEGHKVLMYCSRCATPISKAEIAMDNSYKDVSDQAVYVKFGLTQDSINQLAKDITFDFGNSQISINILAWTTTPWTLPANVALAVNSGFNYQLIEYKSEFYILASQLVGKVFDESEIKLRADFTGCQLINLVYEPLFDNSSPQTHKIVEADYVSSEEGTGIVHLAPAYGEEDYNLALQLDLPIIENIDDYGVYSSGLWLGQSVWGIDQQIIDYLTDKGRLLKSELYRHSYPHCHRCQTRLMYKAHVSWFLNIDRQRQKMLLDNQKINWFPSHIKNKRFKNIVQSAPDWNISRDRLWATPLPVWRGVDPKTQKEQTIVVGSYAELEELSGQTLDDYHRPWIDQITFKKDGITYARIDKVLDCWFESGSMPFAQHHYPFDNQTLLENNFPADFIVEYVGQVRAWFYYLHALGVALFKKPAFSNVIVTGTILGNDGRKISKSLGNYTDPLELINKYSADAYRLVLINSPVLIGEDFVLTTKAVADSQRKLDTLRNALEFFLLYATADNWQLDEAKHQKAPKSPENILDQWLLAQLSYLHQKISQQFEAYNLPVVAQVLIDFIEDLSNWYIRRNRRRFWKTDNDQDKEQAYHTLYFTLYILAHLLAPVCPFLAEEIYQKLTSPKLSIHLNDWPDFSYQADDLIEQMTRLRQYITVGLSLRAEAGIKVRQPLAKITISEVNPSDLNLSPKLQTILLEELNLKSVDLKQADEPSVDLDTHLTDELKQEGLVRELVRSIQILRKQTNLEVEDRIILKIKAIDEIQRAISKFSDYIQTETLAKSLNLVSEISDLYSDQTICRVSDEQVILSLKKS